MMHESMEQSVVLQVTVYDLNITSFTSVVASLHCAEYS
jgi:hypothetical protein